MGRRVQEAAAAGVHSDAHDDHWGVVHHVAGVPESVVVASDAGVVVVVGASEPQTAAVDWPLVAVAP